MRSSSKGTITVALTLLLALLALAPSAVAEVVDRIVATVNGRVILQSDLDEALCYDALLSGRSLADFTDDDRRATLDRLIDQELLREQMKSADFPHATDTEVSARIADARKQYPQAVTDESWRSLLTRYHISEKELFAHVRQQVDVMRLVDARLRPAVQIDTKSIEAYYRDQFVPKLKQSGAFEVPLPEVSAKIRELLTEEKVSEMLVSWLQTLRSEGQVHIPGVTPSPSEPGVQSQ
ncbi:MAG TPA: SurA N-terminal domain-containing protein [Candidatus Acidoferrales bacterium]|jgi:peptidyl-prolyl cis-trans isomerase SurA|nr:SurA N-terminal domain-containing protein [Candidatus Acidoferrales bacterium]